MQEYKIQFFVPPFGQGPRDPTIILVEAESPDIAESVLRDHFTRSGRVDGDHIRIVKVQTYERPTGGCVIGYA
jgi:hypothetical protein